MRSFLKISLLHLRRQESRQLTFPLPWKLLFFFFPHILTSLSFHFFTPVTNFWIFYQEESAICILPRFSDAIFTFCSNLLLVLDIYTPPATDEFVLILKKFSLFYYAVTIYFLFFELLCFKLLFFIVLLINMQFME